MTLLLPILLVATAAGGVLYTQWPAIQQRTHGARQAAETQRQAERAAVEVEEQARQAAADAERERALRRLLDAPVDNILTSIIRALKPAQMREDDDVARAGHADATDRTAVAKADLITVQASAPTWSRRPVLLALVLAAVPAAVLVIFANMVFDFMMLDHVTGVVVALVLAWFIPVGLLGATGLVSFGSGLHSDGERSPAMRAMTFVGGIAILALLFAIYYLAPLRTLESHQAEIADKSATVNSLTAQNADSPDDTPSSVVEAAQVELAAAKKAADADADVQRAFGVGLGLTEILFAEVALFALLLLPVALARRRLNQAELAEAQAALRLKEVQRVKADTIERTATAGLEYLLANGVPNPREVILQAIAEAGVINTAVATADLNVLRGAVTSTDESHEGHAGARTATEGNQTRPEMGPVGEPISPAAIYVPAPTPEEVLDFADSQEAPLPGPPTVIEVGPEPRRSAGQLDDSLSISDFDNSA